ncbi:unnamed protein product [Cyprideis torosa]|uniref:Uncharacterized protein n=1 Tax=Cyprideis torosa TaxID=163714 RepID=A0A7R8ZL87_9CRUS|nr:unnamed protein product [Cyprideis torosa]CAG0886062.1 unnamed protein product [Cyprideis torosa]
MEDDGEGTRSALLSASISLINRLDQPPIRLGRSLICQLLFRNASSALYQATGNRLYFKRISLLIPDWWDLAQCGLTHSQISSVPRIDSGNADFLVQTRTPGVGDRPWTLQVKGCGRSGERTYIPVTFLQSVSSNGDENEARARLLVREWAKLRYGIFDEGGFVDDPLYPAFYKEYIEEDLATPGRQADPERPTTCSDHPIVGNKVCPGGRCQFYPVSEENQNVTASLMALPILDSARVFCNQSTHNRLAPTKHNLLCDGRSTWEVIQSHPDLNGLFPSPTASVPESLDFHIVVPRTHQLLFVLDSFTHRDIGHLLHNTPPDSSDLVLIGRPTPLSDPLVTRILEKKIRTHEILLPVVVGGFPLPREPRDVDFTGNISLIAGGRHKVFTELQEAQILQETLQALEELAPSGQQITLSRHILAPSKPDEVLAGTFTVDQTLDSVSLRVFYPIAHGPRRVSVTAPSGEVFDQATKPDAGYSADVIALTNPAQVNSWSGEWTFVVESISEQKLVVEISGSTQDPNHEVILKVWTSWDNIRDPDPQTSPVDDGEGGCQGANPTVTARDVHLSTVD